MTTQKGRPKQHTTPYTGDKQQLESAFNDYLSCVADCFGNSYDDRDDAISSVDSTSLRDVCDEFNISIPKARKLLITVGVYSTEKSRTIAALSAQGKIVEEIAQLTGLSRSSVSSYLPYKSFPYNLSECSRHAEDSRKYRERRKAVEELCDRIKRVEKSGVVDEKDNKISTDELDAALWQCIIAFQNYPLHTTSGLPFSYAVKKKKNGGYSGELIVSRKEESKTLTKSSVLLAFHKVLERIQVVENIDSTDVSSTALLPLEYKGPKAIGQIFGISYVYYMSVLDKHQIDM